MAKLRKNDVNIDAFDFNAEIKLTTDIDIEETEHTEHSSHFIVLCENDKQDDFIRDFFNLGVRTKSGRGKYETNIIKAEEIIKIILELWQHEE